MDFFETYRIFSNPIRLKFTFPYFLLLTFTLFPFFSNSQVTAPVQASITLSKPYSLRLSDYVQAGTSHISANLTLLNNTSDPTVDRVQVKLRLIIENNTIRISTPETYQSPNSITLTEGVPELLDANDLAEYFDPKNLDFVGLDKAQYLQTGRLPEGFYTFRLEVYEYFRGTRLTNQSPSALAWLMLNDPPRWVIPSANQKLTATNPQNLLFQWLPMHTGSPNAVSGVQYDLTMVELWPNTTQNPNDALNTLSPFYTVNDIETNSLLIGPDAPQLVPGRTYALRLRARDFSGFDLFKNNGYSEVVAFTFGDACLAAESPSAKARNSREADVNWLSKSNHSAYQVKYREAGQTVWYTDNASINDWTIRNLNPSKTYEYTIAAQCQTLLSPETDVATFVTPAATKADGNCDSPSPTTNAVNKSARKVLFPGESYTSAKTGKVMLTMDNIIKQPNGKFGGVGSSNFGWMPVPFAVEVTDLEVDLDGVLLDGKFKTITYGVYVIDARTYAQAEGTLNYAATLLSGNPPSDANLAKLQDTLKSIRNLPPAAAALIQQGIAEIKAGKTDSGKATVQQGLAQAKTELGRAANKGGNVIGGGNANGKDLKPITGLNITFSNAPESKYGFDVKTDDLLASTYEQENGTYIPWKAIESGKTDPLLVTVSITGNKIKRDSIRYSTQSGAKLALANNRISPVGGSDGIKTELYALYPTTGSGTQNVAQVNVVGYTKEMNTVVIIPLGAALPMTSQVLMDSLNLIFGQAVAGFSVEVKPVFKSGWTGTISIGGTGMLAAYTQSQRDIINEFKNANKDFSSSKYYVFVGGTPSDRSIMGYMPRARKYGFIFDRTTTAKTLAHELGHGVFHLQHAFDEKQLPRTGNNLMSYGSGTKLHKYQWDKVHNPEFVLGLLEEDSAAMARTLFDAKNILFRDEFYTSYKKVKTGEIVGFTQPIISSSDVVLKKLGDEKKPTIVYFSRKECSKDDFKSKKHLNYKINQAKDEITSLNLGAANVLFVLNFWIFDNPGDSEYEVSTYEQFWINSSLDSECGKDINGYIEKMNSSSSKTKFNLDYDKTLKDRVDYIYSKLKDCELDNNSEGIQRSEIAKNFDLNDTRVYNQVFSEYGKIGDEFVDCAEFVYDVLKEQGFTNFNEFNCNGQKKWFEGQKSIANYSYSSTSIKIGDIVYWNNYGHTGIVSRKDGPDVYVIASGLNGCNCISNCRLTCNEPIVKCPPLALSDLDLKKDCEECFQKCKVTTNSKGKDKYSIREHKLEINGDFYEQNFNCFITPPKISE